MTEFLAQLRRRADEALRCLEQARAAGDDFLAAVHTGELESIAQIAHEHALPLPELDAFRSPAA